MKGFSVIKGLRYGKTVNTNRYQNLFMQVRFNNSYLEKVYAGLPVSGKPKYNNGVIEKFKKVVRIIKNVENSVSLKQFRSLNFEALKGDKRGLYSVRVDIKYRLEFRIGKDKISFTELALIEKLSKHYE